MPSESWHTLAFDELLKRYRIAVGLTQEELAERAQVSVRSIGDLERGSPHRPRKETLQFLALALNLSPDDRAAFMMAAAAQRLPPAATFASPIRGGAASPPLVGRTRELTLLERHLAGDGPPMLLLVGEPGIGKTRLLREAASRGLKQGLSVLEGGCQRHSGQEPYAPLLGALEGRIHRLHLGQLCAELEGCAWLVRLLPELAETTPVQVPQWTLPPEQERRLMFAAVGRFLANDVGPAGTLLVLDDLQWAGPDALDLLMTVVRSTSETSLRIVGAYRDTDVRPQDSLSLLLADLAREGLVAQHELGPLAPEAAVELLSHLLYAGEGTETRVGVLMERVLQRTGGVPFFLVSCAQSLRARALEGSELDAVPWDIAQSIRQRMVALPEGGQEVLRMAAVIGRRISRSLLVSIERRSGREEDAVLMALEAACRARLLVEEEEGYYFAHDLIREVVVADLSVARRALLHRRLVETLEQGAVDPTVEQLAYHY